MENLLKIVNKDQYTYDKVMELMAATKDVPVFEYDGVFFIGSRTVAIREYVVANSSDKFYVWLHKNYTILNPVNK